MGTRTSNTGALLASDVASGYRAPVASLARLNERRQDGALDHHAAQATALVDHADRLAGLAGQPDDPLERLFHVDDHRRLHASRVDAVPGGVRVLELSSEALGGNVAVHAALAVDHQHAGEAVAAHLGARGVGAV